MDIPSDGIDYGYRWGHPQPILMAILIRFGCESTASRALYSHYLFGRIALLLLCQDIVEKTGAFGSNLYEFVLLRRPHDVLFISH